MENRFTLKIFRGTARHQYWEYFELTLKPFFNIISALMEIQKHPFNQSGKKVSPIAWEQGCLEEVCGSCSMLINGKPRQACTSIIEPILERTKKREIHLAPLSKFPLIRDLVVDRSSMFENLKRIKGWVSVDGSFLGGFGPKIDQKKQETMYSLATCMTCGCCSEACPQVNTKSKFMGPAPISQVRLFNLHPTGKMEADVRTYSLMEDGGIGGCGNAQNCVRVCPKNIPLTESIAVMGRAVSKKVFKSTSSSRDQDCEA